jgi:ureidoacrylate peracid hydrolase
MNKTALLVIDMQNDFILPKAIIEVEKIKENIIKHQKFIQACRKEKIEIIFTKHIFDIEKNPIEGKMFPVLKKRGLRDKTKGVEIHNSIKPSQKDIVIEKNRYDAFIGTKLEQILRNKGIDTVIITGTMTNICCESTARTAMMKDFNVLFCSDLTFTKDQEIHKNTLKNISTHFGTVMTSEEIYQEHIHQIKDSNL